MTTPPPNQPPQREKGGFLQAVAGITGLMKDWVAHVIAMGIVAASLLLLTTELLGDGDDKIQTAQGVASIVGPWVGVIIGFYFGARSGEKQAEAAELRAEKRVESASAETEVAEEEQDSALVEAHEKIRELEGRLEQILEGQG